MKGKLNQTKKQINFNLRSLYDSTHLYRICLDPIFDCVHGLPVIFLCFIGDVTLQSIQHVLGWEAG